MGTLTIVASVTGFLAAQFVTGLYAEQVADWYNDAYAQGFYLTAIAPTDGSTAGVITDADRLLVAKQCGLPNGDPMALAMTPVPAQ